MKKAVILTDGKAGHENQSKAFARALGLEPVLVQVAFKSKIAKTLSYLLDWLGIHSKHLFKPHIVPQGDYAVVIGTGSGVFYAVKVLAQGRHLPSAVILYPRGYKLADYSCILAPSFDQPKRAPNILPIPVNLVAMDEAFYQAGCESFRARYAGETKNAVAVIIGGPNGHAQMEPAWIKAQLDALFAQTQGRPHWVTTSRRTPAAVDAVVDAYPWDYQLCYAREKYNPIPAFVSLAETLYVTAESTGMLSETCSRGAARVEVLDNLIGQDHKFARFVKNLREGGYVGGNRKVDLSPIFAQAACLVGLQK